MTVALRGTVVVRRTPAAAVGLRAAARRAVARSVPAGPVPQAVGKTARGSGTTGGRNVRSSVPMIVAGRAGPAPAGESAVRLAPADRGARVRRPAARASVGSRVHRKEGLAGPRGAKAVPGVTTVVVPLGTTGSAVTIGRVVTIVRAVTSGQVARSVRAVTSVLPGTTGSAARSARGVTTVRAVMTGSRGMTGSAVTIGRVVTIVRAVTTGPAVRAGARGTTARARAATIVREPASAVSAARDAVRAAAAASREAVTAADVRATVTGGPRDADPGGLARTRAAGPTGRPATVPEAVTRVRPGPTSARPPSTTIPCCPMTSPARNSTPMRAPSCAPFPRTWPDGSRGIW
ncbi:type III secretory pathway component EscS [Actinomadura viridis]|uniref:Type III secretory pathway component EscS n=1 Tax=Actinomadura viridis TaxID=58110 RepID=A0A931DM98_9ACTN|nr:type III secretory pathway component EscS [Actinomadura viridis]